MDHTAQERPCCQDNGASGETASIGETDAANMAIRKEQIGHLALDDREMRRFSKLPLHLSTIDGAVALSARRLDSRAAASIEDAKMDADSIGDDAHEAAKSINLAHEVALGDAANSRIARHLGDCVHREGDERCAATHAGGCMSGLASGVPAADDDHVKVVIEIRSSHFPMQKVEKI
jgi:hypothetical protein